MTELILIGIIITTISIMTIQWKYRREDRCHKLEREEELRRKSRWSRAKDIFNVAIMEPYSDNKRYPSG